MRSRFDNTCGSKEQTVASRPWKGPIPSSIGGAFSLPRAKRVESLPKPRLASSCFGPLRSSDSPPVGGSGGGGNEPSDLGFAAKDGASLEVVPGVPPTLATSGCLS
eukprot:7375914-Prymnesium_polylepis.2